jgi:cytochrome c5
MNKKIITLTILLGAALLLSAACRLVTGTFISPTPTVSDSTSQPSVLVTTEAPAQPTLSAPTATSAVMDGKALLQDRCNVCHSLDYIYSSRGTRDQWAQLVAIMISNGAMLNQQEEQILVDYLAKNFGQ